MGFKSSFAIAVMGMSIAACGGNHYAATVAKGVQDNEKATSLVEWETSDSNPDTVFPQWREEYAKDPSKLSDEQNFICESLLGLDGVHLEIYQEQIEEQDNAVLLAPCLTQLKTNLAQHFADQRKTLQVPVSVTSPQPSANAGAFKFTTNVEYRDTAKGYFALTGDAKPKQIFLTFDDGPSPYTESILRTLKEVGAKATFFEMAKNVRVLPNVTKEVAADGHSIGSHTVTHACIGSHPVCAKAMGHNYTMDEALAEIRGGHQALREVLGWVDPFFRFPYGEDSPELRKYLMDNQVGEFYWTVDSNDWRAQTNDHLIQTVLASVDKAGKGIILFHDIQQKTAESLPQILRELYKRGYTLGYFQSSDPNARHNTQLMSPASPIEDLIKNQKSLAPAP